MIVFTQGVVVELDEKIVSLKVKTEPYFMLIFVDT